MEVLKLTEIDSLQEKAEYADGILNLVEIKLSSACGALKIQLLTLVPDKWSLNKVRQQFYFLLMGSSNALYFFT